MKAILIARVSTEEQKEMGNSLPAQVARLEKYCQNRNLEILKVFSFDESAYKQQRDEFDTILDFIMNCKEKVAICCDKVDRLTRNVFDKRISTLHEKALKDELELHFVSDGQVVSSRISATEKFQFQMSLGLAKYYCDAISDNVKRSIESKLKRGEWPSRAPYGYKNVVINGKKDIEVNEYEAFLVKKAFELYATGAFSLELVAKKISEDFNVHLPKSNVEKIFLNPFYYGIMVIKGKEQPHKYPPLISKSLFDQVQQIKATFNKKPFKYAGKPYIYRGLIRCAECDLAITPEKHKGYVYYHCTQYNGKHDAKWLREETITAQIGKIFKSLQMPKDVSKQILDTLEEVHVHKVEFQRKQHALLIKEQKETTEMMDNLYIDKLKGRITESAYDKFYQSFKDKQTNINIRLEQLQEADDNYYITVKHILRLTNEAYDLFMSSEVEQKRQLIKLVLSNLKLDGENLVYEAHTPFNLILKSSEDLEWRP